MITDWLTYWLTHSHLVDYMNMAEELIGVGESSCLKRDFATAKDAFVEAVHVLMELVSAARGISV